MDELLNKMDEQMQVRGFAAMTRQSYLRSVRKFGEHFGCCPSELGLEHVESFLLHLCREAGYHAATRNVYAAGLRFFFGTTLGQQGWARSVPRAKAPRHLPVVLSGDEVRRLLSAFRCGAGLRVSEACGLRVEDIDGERHRLLIRHATKGAKHRQLPLTPRLHQQLRAYY
ncbi:MAG: site-specific integrase, partial [Chloroflexota bacterium]